MSQYIRNRNDSVTFVSRIIIIFFIMAIITGIAPIVASAAAPSDIYVNTTGWWRADGAFNESNPRIQAAIDNATAGDTIYVYNGSYSENVNVNKQVTLQGEGVDLVNVTAALASGHVFNVTVSYVNISGFNVTGATGGEMAGIYLGNGVDNANIFDNNASNNYYAIYLNSSSNNKLTNNSANSNRNDGIKLNSLSNNNMLTNNTAILNGRTGISLISSSNNNTLTNNTANSNLHGIGLMTSSNNNTVTNNTANSNTQRGIFLNSAGNNNTLTNNTANSNTLYGIWLSSSSNNTIYNNYFNNTNNAWDDGYNVWNTTITAGTNIIGGSYLGGNYWSNYAGEDTDGDRLGDTLTPYNSSGIITNGGDYLPLMTVDTTAPSITIISPVNTTYIHTSILLNVTTDQTANVTYSLNGAANSSLYNLTTGGNATISGREGENNITVYASDSAGNLNSSIVYFTVETAPVVTASKTYSDYAQINPMTIDSNINVTDGDINVTGAKVSIGDGYVISEDYLNYTIINGITGSYNTTTGILTLTGNRSGSDYQAAFRNVSYWNNNTNNPNRSQRNITFAIGNNSLYYPGTGHYYEYVPANLYWTNSNASANNRTFYGLQGYLATINSSEENTFLKEKVSGDAWIGASDSAVEGDWRWVTGPEAGTLFFIGTGASHTTFGYSNWEPGEPNDYNMNEDYAYMYSGSGHIPGTWNDKKNESTNMSYFTEYGGMAEDPTLHLTAMVIVNVIDIMPPMAPTISVPIVGASLTSAYTWVNGTMSADTTNLTVYVNGSITNNSVSVSGTTYSISNVPLGSDGVHEINVSAKDAAGNVNSTNATVIVTVDMTAPYITIISPVNTSYNNASIVLNVTTDQTANVTYSLNGATNLSLYNLTTGGNTTIIGTEGENNITVYANDSAGNTGSATVNFTIYIPIDIYVNQTGWWRPGGVFNASATRIQAAINNATAGDTIYVYNGSYSENVNVNKAVTLQGEGAGVVTVTAASVNDHVFEVAANYVNISGFKAIGATGTPSHYAGIYLGSVNYANISNNNASKNHHGIYLVSSSNNTLTNNTANSNTDNGIWIFTSSNNTLTNNTVNLNLHGFDVQASSNYNTLSGNNASSNGAYGFWVEVSSNYNTFSGNNVSSNTQYGILLTSSSNNTIYNNYFNNTHNAYDNRNNTWNTTKTEGRNIINGSYFGGNYWSNYAGADTIGSDGLGDTLTPYNSSGSISNGGDYQPLVTIGIADTTAPVITISSPLEGLTYNTSAVALNVSANESITSWQYNIDNTGNVTFTPDITLPGLPDGTHNITVYANDSAGNMGSAMVNVTMDTTASPLSITGYAPSSSVSDSTGAARTFNISTDQVVNVTWYLNGTQLFTNTSVTEANYTNSSAGSGTWNITAIVNNINGTDSREWTWIVMTDNMPPVITISVPVNNANISIFDRIISGSITDDSAITANMYVNSLFTNTWSSKGSFRRPYNFTNGSNTINISATDAYNNINWTNISVFVLSPVNEASLNLTANQSLNITANDSASVDVVLSTGNNTANITVKINASINASHFNVSDIDIEFVTLGIARKSLVKFVDINATGDVVNLSSVKITMFYNDSDLDLNGNGIIDAGDIKEDTLNLYWYWDNATSGSQEWFPLTLGADYSGKLDRNNNSGPIVSSVEKNTAFKYISVSSDHFSVYSIAGASIPATTNTTTTTTTSGGGSGSGGSGVVTSEASENIAFAEMLERNLETGKPVTYSFMQNQDIVYEVSVTGKEYENNVAMRIEILKDRSKQVKENAPGLVYRNVNIILGTENIGENVIKFKVKDSWLLENGLDSSDIRLAEWIENEWILLETGVLFNKDGYTHFSAKSTTLSIYAITGIKKEDIAPASLATEKTAVTPEAAPLSTEEQIPQPEGKTPLWMWLLPAVLIIAALVYVLKRR